MIEKLPFGRTGHISTRTIFGAASLKACTQEEADGVLTLLLEHGVNHIDTAPAYGDAELRIGPWMEQHRDAFFLATKTRERGYATAREQIRRSLERLRVEQIDLLQLHNLVDLPAWQTAMRPGGALEAAIEAKERGLVRFIGVTGHGLGAPKMHLRSLDRYPFDSVLFPYNFAMMSNPEYRADVKALLRVCGEREIAAQTIKSLARAEWGDREPTRDTWYEPLESRESIDLAVHYVLGQRGVFLNTVGDIRLLPKVLDAAERFTETPSADRMRQDHARHGVEPLFAF